MRRHGARALPWARLLCALVMAASVVLQIEAPAGAQTPSETSTPVVEPTPTETWTPTVTSTPTETWTPTMTPPPTQTSSPTETLTPTATAALVETATPAETLAATATPIETPTLTPVATATLVETLTVTATPIQTLTVTATPTQTVTMTATPTDTPTVTVTSTVTPTMTPTVTPTLTPTSTPTPTPTLTVTPTPTSTPGPSVTAMPMPTVGVPSHGDADGYSPTSDSCAKCHRTHSGAALGLRNAATEEQSCYTCHDGTGGPNVKSQFSKVATHPMAISVGIHMVGESQPASFSGANRHVECVDCHDPHYTQKGNHIKGSSWAGGTLHSSWGIAVANGGAWTTPTFSKAAPVQSEYQLCLKCHSSWAYGNSPPNAPSGGYDQTDQAREFNVNNVSYHWVQGDQYASDGATPRTYDGRSMTFTADSGWTTTSRMSCSDCHASETDADLRGPHGSNQAFLLRAGWRPSTGKSNTSTDLCFQCHDWNTYGEGGTNTTVSATSFSDQSQNLHVFHLGQSSVTGCQSCHNAVPHGSQSWALLVDVDDPAPYNRGGSQLQVLSWLGAGGNWQKEHCGTCHSP